MTLCLDQQSGLGARRLAVGREGYALHVHILAGHPILGKDIHTHLGNLGKVGLLGEQHHPFAKLFVARRGDEKGP